MDDITFIFVFFLILNICLISWSFWMERKVEKLEREVFREEGEDEEERMERVDEQRREKKRKIQKLIDRPEQERILRIRKNVSYGSRQR